MLRFLGNYLLSPAPLVVCALFRVVYAGLLLLNVLILLPDLDLWFSTSGLGSVDITANINNQSTFTVFSLLPYSAPVVYCCYSVFLIQIILLILGFRTQFQSICVFLWLQSFFGLQSLIWDGSDIVFSLFGFFLIFLPSRYHFSIDSARKDISISAAPPIWPLRLIQFEMILIYLSSAIAKCSGATWRDGTALYYVYHLHDLFGRFPIPDIFLQSATAVKISTWLVLFTECMLPFLLMIPTTRFVGIMLAMLLHLGIEYSMNLALFQWIMLCGLIAFADEKNLLRLVSRFMNKQ